MHILILIIGLLIGGFALYRFMLNASPKEIVRLILTIGVLVIASALFFLAITGRLPIAIGIVGAIAPIVMSWWNAKKKTEVPKGEMSIYDALEILGLKEDATDDEISDAHKRLMKKVHPDQE